jgi:MoaA/NifB/PqqE/SkfB family radical SAM enzyme
MSSLSNQRLKIFNHLEALTNYCFGREFSYPISAEIDLTNNCNLDCFGCDMKHVRGNDELDLDTLKHIIDQLRQMNCKAITWTGGGEPLCSQFGKKR